MTGRYINNLATWKKEKVQYSKLPKQDHAISVGESKEMIQQLLESFHGPAVMVDGKGMTEYCNSCGMSEEEMIDYDCLKILHPEDVHIVRKHAADMLKGKDKL